MSLTCGHVVLSGLEWSPNVCAVRHEDGRAAGVLLAAAGTADAIDATVVLLAAPGDRIVTSDPDDLTRLAAAAVNRPAIIPC